MVNITGITLQKICPNVKIERANELASLLNKIFVKYNINTPQRAQAFIAQIAHESGEFVIKTENMNYTTPNRLVTIWPSRFNLDGSNGKLNANNYVRNASKLANEVYANRMGNGNQESGDGYRYRGGGFLQLTGKESYESYAKYLNKPIEDTAQLVHDTDEYALDSAAWEFCVDKKLLDEADAGDFLTITKRINGGTIGLEERKRYYERAKKVIF